MRTKVIRSYHYAYLFYHSQSASHGLRAEDVDDLHPPLETINNARYPFVLQLWLLFSKMFFNLFEVTKVRDLRTDFAVFDENQRG